MSKNVVSVVHPLEILKNKDSKILILGSFPSVKSREAKFYYMNPSNRFYQIMSLLFDEDFYLASITKKKEMLKKHHIALYDVVTKCDIVNSSDSSITNCEFLDLENILKKTEINHIFLNGDKAYSLFVKQFPKYESMATKLPSTSPANCKMSLAELVMKWSIIKDYL